MSTKAAIISAVLLASIVLGLVGLYWNYENESRDADRHAQDNCVLRAVSKALMQEYGRVGSFPEPGNIDDFVYSVGYPDNLGCGTVSRNDSTGQGFVDTTGAPFSYDFSGPDQVALSGNQPLSKNPRRYELTPDGVEIVEQGTGERVFLATDEIL